MLYFKQYFEEEGLSIEYLPQYFALEDNHPLLKNLSKENLIKITEEEYNSSLRLQEVNLQIANYKQKLTDTDYITLKYFENLISDEEFENMKIERQKWRDIINNLEIEYNEILNTYPDMAIIL